MTIFWGRVKTYSDPSYIFSGKLGPQPPIIYALGIWHYENVVYNINYYNCYNIATIQSVVVLVTRVACMVCCYLCSKVDNRLLRLGANRTEEIQKELVSASQLLLELLVSPFMHFNQICVNIQLGSK